MFCSNCGKEIKEEDRFCQNCGAKNEFFNENNKINEENVCLKLENNYESDNKLKAKKPLVKQLIIEILIFLVIIGFGYSFIFGNNDSKEENKNKYTKESTYEKNSNYNNVDTKEIENNGNYNNYVNTEKNINTNENYSNEENNTNEFKYYYNEKYGYSISYPNELTDFQEYYGNDIVASNKDSSVMLHVHASENKESLTVNDLSEWLRSRIEVPLDYEDIRYNSFVFLWHIDEKFNYYYYVVGKNKIVYFSFTYPKSEAAKYYSDLNKIRDSFNPGEI